MADDDGPIVLGVSDCFQIEGLEEGGWFPVTVEVRDLLAQLCRVSPLGVGARRRHFPPRLSRL